MSLTNKVAQFDADSDLVNAWVHGPASGAGSTVTTDSGAVRTPAKLIADNEAEIQVVVDLASDWANGPISGTNSTVVMGGVPVKSPAKLIDDKNIEINQGAVSVLALSTAQANIAIAQANDATTQASLATSAKVAAELARDISLVQAGVYVDEPTGRAAVADGVAFKVQGSGNIAAYEYRRVSAGVASTLIATYPSVSGVYNKAVTSGDVKALVIPDLYIGNGATTIPLGITVPIGSTGQTSYVAYGIPFDKVNTALVGQKIKITCLFDIVGDLLTVSTHQAKVNVHTALAIRLGVQLSSSVAYLPGSTTKAVAYYEYVVVGDEIKIFPYVQLLGTVAMLAKASITLTGIRYEILTEEPKAYTGNDLMLGIKLAEIEAASGEIYTSEPLGRAAVSDGQLFDVLGTGAIGKYVYRRTNSSTSVLVASFPSNAAVDSRQVSTGNITAEVSNTGQMFNGAAFTLVGGKVTGFTVPSGQTGVNSYAAATILPLGSADLPKLVGSTLKFWLECTVTANFAVDKTIIDGFLTAKRGAAFVNVGEKIRKEQIGTKLYIEARYTVTGADERIDVFAQIQASNSTATTHTLTIVSTGYIIESLPARNENYPTLQDKSLDWRIDQKVTPVATAIVPHHFGIGPVYADLVPAPQNNGGSVPRILGGKAMGWTIPAGQTGQNTVAQWKVPIHSEESPLFAGRTLKVTLKFDTSDNYTRIVGYGFQSIYNGNVVRQTANTTLLSTVTTTNSRVMVLSASLEGDEDFIQPYVFTTVTDITAEDAWLVLTDMVVEITASPSTYMTLMEENLQMLRKRAVREAAVTSDAAIAASIPTIKTYGTGTYNHTVTVKPDGSGDFTTFRAAALSIVDASASNTYEIVLYNPHEIITDHTLANWFLPAYVDVRYSGPGYGWLEYHFPASTDTATIIAKSGFWHNYTSKLTGLKVTMQNGRYAIHSDGSVFTPDQELRLVDCWIQHLGNQEAIDYQTSLGGGGNPGGVWPSTTPWGYGSASGHIVEFERTTFTSKTAGGYVHTNNAFAKPTKMHYKNCRLIATTAGATSMTVQPLGSGQRDIVQLDNCELRGDIVLNTWPWIPTTNANQPSDRSEIAVYLNNCSPTAFKYSDTALALSIKSVDTTSIASLVLGGTAVATLFGTPVILAGGGGLPAQTYSSIDVSGAGVGIASDVFITSMGYRLGDCSTVNKTLTITFNGGQVATVTFNLNYTAVNNATILAAINTAIQTAFSNGGLVQAELLSVFGTTRPYVLDQEMVMYNEGTVGLVVGMGVKYGVVDSHMTVMLSTDAADTFAGIALERILPGAWGRVRKTTHCHFGVAWEISRSDSASFVRGDTFGIGATPGKFTKGASIPLLKAVNTTNVTGV